ncbi:MAG: UMP kinase [Candidatus Fermentibacteraceae bacterium]|nr:UMP kinase [Candidatus Fermentibacteraceae bacterium]MBN2607779.1 UMP kinase [Candidatus Fermentibacteraceae bacterium]
MKDDSPSAPLRVLLKLSGEVLAGGCGQGIDPVTLDSIAGAVLDLAAEGCAVGIVTGGGNFIRGRDLRSVDRITGDQMGMLATLMNGLALRDAVRRRGGRAVVLSSIPVEGIFETFNPESAGDYLDRDFIVIYAGGTGNPCLTTDTAAALRAVQTGCRRLLKGTKVDGIYETDPESDPDARRFRSISHDDVLRRDLKVMDAAAVAICRDAGLPVSVFDVWKPENIVRVYRDPSVGSLIGGIEDDR